MIEQARPGAPEAPNVADVRRQTVRHGQRSAVVAAERVPDRQDPDGQVASSIVSSRKWVAQEMQGS